MKKFLIASVASAFLACIAFAAEGEGSKSACCKDKDQKTCQECGKSCDKDKCCNKDKKCDKDTKKECSGEKKAEEKK